MIGIVESHADEASGHVCEHVRRLGAFEERQDSDRSSEDGGGRFYRSEAFELRSFDDLHLELEGAAAAFDDPDLVLFASRHAGDTGPLLSAHPTGNFGDAEYGGAARSLARAPPHALATVLDALHEHAPEDYDVSMECTHHGPTDVGAPSMFVELGSGPEEWADPAGAEAVARAILDLTGTSAWGPPEGDGAGAETRRHLVGFGGNHYAPRFARIAHETDWAVGHVAADWSLEELGDPSEHADVLDAAFERSAADVAVVEGGRPDLVAAIEGLGHRVVGETWVRETDGVPLSLVEVAESRLGSVGEGLRFGAPARERAASDAASGLTAVRLPGDLLGAATGIDREATMGALAEHCVAYETGEGGTRPGDRALVAGEGRTRSLVGTLAAILRERYDSIAVEADRIVAEESAFDPALAREAGVEEGPAFGRLSSGESVTVDGEAVEPADVHERRRVTFELPGSGGNGDE